MTYDTHTPFAAAIIAACPGVCHTYVRLLFRLILIDHTVVLPFYVAYIDNKCFLISL